MTTVLLVVRPFGAHGIGDVIATPADMRTVLGGAHVHDVIRVAMPAAVKNKREEN